MDRINMHADLFFEYLCMHIYQIHLETSSAKRKNVKSARFPAFTHSTPYVWHSKT